VVTRPEGLALVSPNSKGIELLDGPGTRRLGGRGRGECGLFRCGGRLGASPVSGWRPVGNFP